MFSYEIMIIMLHLVMLSFAYFFFYPALKCYDFETLGKYDLMVSGATLLIAALFFYNSHISFWLFGWHTNWFWFTVVAGFIVEMPFMLWYIKKYINR